MIHELKIGLDLITCALIDHNTCAIYIGGRSQAAFALKGLGGLINANFASLGLSGRSVKQEEIGG